MHQQLGRIGRDLTCGDDPQVRDRSRLDDVFQLHRTHHILTDASFAAQAELLVDMPFAEVGVDDHDALAGIGKHGAQVLGDEALAEARAGAGDEQGVVGRVHQRKVDRGAQAAQALDGVVFRVADGEKFASLVALGAADDGCLFRAVGDGCINRQSELRFDGFGIFDHHSEGAH